MAREELEAEAQAKRNSEKTTVSELELSKVLGEFVSFTGEQLERIERSQEVFRKRFNRLCQHLSQKHSAPWFASLKIAEIAEDQS